MDKSYRSGNKFMDNAKGMCSYSKNPMPMPRQVKPMCGPGTNPDMQKANMLLQKAQKQVDSQRGIMGM